MFAIRVLEYLAVSGRSPFRRWFDGLDATAAARVGAYLYRLEQGNFSRVEGVGDTVVILLGGSAKKGQSAAIDRAHEAWQDYKRRKRA